MSANIEELVKKHAEDWRTMPAISAQDQIRNAMTEQAEAFKGELAAYDGMVRELTKTVEDMREAQSVAVFDNLVDANGNPVTGAMPAVAAAAAVVGEPTKELAALAYQRAFAEGEAGGDFSLRIARHVAELLKPTHSIPAAELDRLRECEAVLAYVRRVLPMEKWADDSRRMIDAAIAQEKGE